MSEWIDSSEMSRGMKSGFATGDAEEDVSMHFSNLLRDTGIKGHSSCSSCEQKLAEQGRT